MGDDKIQAVRVKMGPLWTFGLILWILIWLIILLTIVLGIVALIALLPKISSALSMLGALSNLGNGNLGGGGGGSYGGGNQSGNSTLNNTQNYLKSLVIQMRADVDQGNWDAASYEMNTIKNTVSQIPSSQLPSGLAQAILGLDQAIRDRSATAFDTIYDQLNQTGA